MKEITWYVKWSCCFIMLIAVLMRSIGNPALHWIDLFLSWIGSAGWTFISFRWKDRALITVNVVNFILLSIGLIRIIFF